MVVFMSLNVNISKYVNRGGARYLHLGGPISSELVERSRAQRQVRV